jgi:hypothetical protein
MEEVSSLKITQRVFIPKSATVKSEQIEVLQFEPKKEPTKEEKK